MFYCAKKVQVSNRLTIFYFDNLQEEMENTGNGFKKVVEDVTFSILNKYLESIKNLFLKFFFKLIISCFKVC